MENKTKKYLVSAALFLLLISSGFVRENLFYRINRQITHENIPEHTTQLIRTEDIIERLSQNHMYSMKWILTGFFTAVFFVLSAFLIRHLFKNKKPLIYISLFYGGVIFVAAICVFIGIVSGHYMESYSIVRPLMGILQSPIPVVVIAPAIWFFEKHIS